MDLDMKVLVVDDFATMRRILKNVLKQIGFTNIIEADDGSTALSVLKKNKVDLIMSDWNMPKVSGLELLKAVRSDESMKNIPFLMVTAEGQKDSVIQAVQAGVSNYIVKPFTAETIKEKLEQIFKK
ncbi:MAG: chemotaxis response regulator CheY [Deltaproteobacteria bacterium]|nr:chemotaxis response regulator CheY [Deltaproteobacteria bacterium]